MDLLNTLLKNSDAEQTLANLAGVDSQSATEVVSKLLPALTGGLQQNLQKSGGAEALAGALQSGNHQRYIDNPASLADAESEGNGILGHLLGSKDASRALAAQVGVETGVDISTVKKMLPMVAALAMGALSKKTDGGEQLQGGVGEILGGLLGGGDSGALGTVTGLAKKFF